MILLYNELRKELKAIHDKDEKDFKKIVKFIESLLGLTKTEILKKNDAWTKIKAYDLGHNKLGFMLNFNLSYRMILEICPNFDIRLALVKEV
jgi:hypothetical protein